MKKTKVIPKKTVVRMGAWVAAATVVTVATVAAINLIKPAPAPTVTASLIPTNLPPSETPAPSDTPVPLPTETVTPAYSIFGRWVPDPSTTTVLVNQPPAGQFCFPDPVDFWVPEIIIEATADPAVVVVKGLHQHIQSQELALDLENQRIEDTFVMANINQSLFLVLQIESDGRLYHEEQDLAGGQVYCSASVYYVRAGE